VVWVRLVRNTNGDGRAPSGNAVKGFGKEIANIPCARAGHGIGAGFVRDGALDPKEDGKQRWKERWREEADGKRGGGAKGGYGVRREGAPQRLASPLDSWAHRCEGPK